MNTDSYNKDGVYILDVPWEESFYAQGCTIESVSKDVLCCLLGEFIGKGNFNNPELTKHDLEYCGKELDMLISFCLESRQSINKAIAKMGE